jgi:uncharacterized phage protein gp47/JayE
MSFQRPTLSALIERNQADIEARLPGADARLRHSALNVLATAHAGAVHGLYGALDWMARQILPDTAEAEVLERHAAVFGLTRKPATLAAGTATATGTDGAVIPAGTALQRAGGVEYVVQAAAVIAGGTATLTLAAVVTGIAGTAPVGTRLAFVSPIAGVNAQATVAGGGLTGGAEAEGDEALRARLLARLRQAPEGGARHDYERWALAVPEVTRVWVYPQWAGAGTVGIAFMMDGRDDPTPLPADVDVLEAALVAAAPVTAELVVFAPTPAPLDLEITGLTPDDPAVRAAVEAEVRDLLFRQGAPGGTILISQLREAISLAAGETDHVLVAPVANVVNPAGHLPVLGTIDWGD